jgi:hypothetical protein
MQNEINNALCVIVLPGQLLPALGEDGPKNGTHGKGYYLVMLWLLHSPNMRTASLENRQH